MMTLNALPTSMFTYDSLTRAAREGFLPLDFTGGLGDERCLDNGTLAAWMEVNLRDPELLTRILGRSASQEDADMAVRLLSWLQSTAGRAIAETMAHGSPLVL